MAISTLKKISRRYFHRSIKLYWWRYEYPHKLNFGDELTPVIINKIFGYRSTWTPIEDCEIVGIGSILDGLRVAAPQKRYVWGSGFIMAGEKLSNANLVFCAVRGKISRSRISNSNHISIGDPGLLANLVFKPSKYRSDKIGIVPHYVDAQHPSIQGIDKNPNFLIIDPLDKPSEVIRKITSCKFILSSSLHGLIVADSFNVPNIHMPLSKNVVGGDYKFRDYYSATGRTYHCFNHKDITDDKELYKLLKKYKPIKNLTSIQNDLIKSFPSL